MTITSKQRAKLRSLSNEMDTIFQIGKGGINDNQLAQISDALEARELIKLRVLDTFDGDARSAAEAVAGATGAEVVSVTGSRFVLYRESTKLKAEKKISL